MGRCCWSSGFSDAERCPLSQSSVCWSSGFSDAEHCPLSQSSVCLLKHAIA
jgi:hypothetical protein